MFETIAIIGMALITTLGFQELFLSPDSKVNWLKHPTTQKLQLAGYSALGLALLLSGLTGIVAAGIGALYLGVVARNKLALTHEKRREIE